MCVTDIWIHREPPSTHYKLSISELRDAARRQQDGWTVGEVAEHFEITVFEAEEQLGIRHTSEGTRYVGVWLAPTSFQARGAMCPA